MIRTGPEMTENSQRNNRVTFLDSLRFIGAAAVVLQHFAEDYSETGRIFVSFLSPGVFGVVLFFIVSGFVMPMSVSGNFDWKSFIIRRVFRIYPLVVFVFLVVVSLAYLRDIESLAYVRQASLYDWIANLLLIQDYVGAMPIWGVTWTLILEIAWYSLFAFSFVIFGRRFNDKLIIGFPVLLIGLAVLSFMIGHRLPLARLGMIYAAVLGCQFYRLHNQEIGLNRLLKDLAAFLIVMMSANLVSFGHFSHPNITLYQALIPWIIAPILFSLFALLPTVRTFGLFDNAAVRWLSVVSYSLYLLHPLAWAFAEEISPHAYLPFIAVLMAIGIAALGYYLVEKPGQNLGREIARSVRKSVGSSSAHRSNVSRQTT